MFPLKKEEITLSSANYAAEMKTTFPLHSTAHINYSCRFFLLIARHPILNEASSCLRDDVLKTKFSTFFSGLSLDSTSLLAAKAVNPSPKRAYCSNFGRNILLSVFNLCCRHFESLAFSSLVTTGCRRCTNSD